MKDERCTTRWNSIMLRSSAYQVDKEKEKCENQ